MTILIKNWSVYNTLPISEEISEDHYICTKIQAI